MLDTLAISKRLKAAGFTDSQAEAEAEVLAEVLQVNLKDLVTKEDLQRSLGELETKVEARLDKFEAKITADFGRLSSEFSHLKVEFASLRGEFTGIRGEMTLVKWMLGVVVGGVVVLILRAFFPI
jgi:hypothetical protein